MNFMQLMKCQMGKHAFLDVSTENNYMYILHVCYVNYMYTTCLLPGGASTKSDYGCTYY